MHDAGILTRVAGRNRHASVIDGRQRALGERRSLQALRPASQREAGARKALSQLRFIGNGVIQKCRAGATRHSPVTRRRCRQVAVGAVPVSIVQSLSEKFSGKG